MVMLLLTGGAIINVAVAWLPFLRAQWPGSQLKVAPFIHDWPVAVPSHWPNMESALQADFPTWTLTRYTAHRNVPKLEPRMSPEDVLKEIKKYQGKSSSKAFIIDRYDCGWPIRSLRAEHWLEFLTTGQPPGTYFYEGHPEPSIWRNGIRARTAVQCLPIGPLWTGFAINTIFCAAILWVLVASAGFVRRRIRARRGQCPACAYPIGSSDVCTECGKPVRSIGRTSV
jgi:hypothetical protein